MGCEQIFFDWYFDYLDIYSDYYQWDFYIDYCRFHNTETIYFYEWYYRILLISFNGTVVTFKSSVYGVIIDKLDNG